MEFVCVFSAHEKAAFVMSCLSVDVGLDMEGKRMVCVCVKKLMGSFEPVQVISLLHYISYIMIEGNTNNVMEDVIFVPLQFHQK